MATVETCSFALSGLLDKILLLLKSDLSSNLGAEQTLSRPWIKMLEDPVTSLVGEFVIKFTAGDVSLISRPSHKGCS